MIYVACVLGHDAGARLLRILQHTAPRAPDPEKTNPCVQPTTNAVLRQWNALSPARQGFRRYDWSFADLLARRSRVDGGTMHNPAAFRQLAVIGLALPAI